MFGGLSIDGIQQKAHDSVHIEKLDAYKTVFNRHNDDDDDVKWQDILISTTTGLLQLDKNSCMVGIGPD